jgi:hypothetical protein
MMRWYIAGPMTGYSEWNFPAFNKAADHLTKLGHTAVNPVDINPDTTTPWIECMKADLRALIDCDAIYMLSGWNKSKGATLEYVVATGLGLEVFYEDEND